MGWDVFVVFFDCFVVFLKSQRFFWDVFIPRDVFFLFCFVVFLKSRRFFGDGIFLGGEGVSQMRKMYMVC